MQGTTFMLIGTADELPKAPEKPQVFMEDLSEDQAMELQSVCSCPRLDN